MVKGFKSTLFAGVITLSAFTPVFAAAPIISGLPDIQVGDLEDSISTDSNLFVFSNAFPFSAYVNDTDTADNLLKWSFAEYTNPDLAGPQYTINGVGPILNGDAAIAAAELAGNPGALNPANQINASSDLASFRDILFSPGTGSGPFADPSQAAAEAAAEGKALRFYVSDGVNVAFQDTLIRTVDDGADMLTDSDGYEELVRDTDFTSGWINSGLGWAAATNGTAPGRLTMTVTPSQGRNRTYGWQNPNLLTYDQVGPTKTIRGKFFVYASNSFYAPVNQVPGFRLRVTNEGVLNSAVNFEYAQTGITDPVGRPPFYSTFNNPEAEFRAGYWIRPSDDPAVPSLYRVDLDPMELPSMVGSDFGALMESFATPDPANGTLSLTEVIMATYDSKTDAEGNLLYDYNKLTGLAVGAGGIKSVNGGGFNADPQLVHGRRHEVFLNSQYVFANNGVAGVTGDTNNVPDNVWGIGLIDFRSVNGIDKLRISPDKLYRARFYATSSVPIEPVDPNVERQSNISFRFQTAALTAKYTLDLPTLAYNVGNPKADEITREAIPGIGSLNPETDPTLDTLGEDGGWYTMMVPSLLDSNGVRKDFNDDFFLFGVEPGPGSPEATSARDVVLGVDLLQIPRNLLAGPEPGTMLNNFAVPNRAQVRISAVKVFEYDAIDDGGYDPTP